MHKNYFPHLYCFLIVWLAKLSHFFINHFPRFRIINIEKGNNRGDQMIYIKTANMKTSIQITAILDQPELLENLVEKLAYRRYDIGYGNQKVPISHEALETASSTIYLSGTVEVAEQKEQFNMPFITSFLFTCIKGVDGVYKLAWSSSLS